MKYFKIAIAVVIVMVNYIPNSYAAGCCNLDLKEETVGTEQRITYFEFNGSTCSQIMLTRTASGTIQRRVIGSDPSHYACNRNTQTCKTDGTSTQMSTSFGSVPYRNATCIDNPTSGGGGGSGTNPYNAAGCGIWINSQSNTPSSSSDINAVDVGVKTPIGCIDTRPNELIKFFLRFGIGIGSGIAFALILMGSFKLLTSQGNPEGINAGKETITSAIIGLVFIILSVTVLQIIGMDILGLQAFGL